MMLTPEQIRETKDHYDLLYRDAVKAVGLVKREIRLLQKDCPHLQTKPVGNDTELCAACDKPFSV